MADDLQVAPADDAKSPERQAADAIRQSITDLLTNIQAAVKLGLLVRLSSSGTFQLKTGNPDLSQLGTALEIVIPEQVL